ncbi:MAG: hypothetical protein KIT09_29085 [Bryobacteraceae bacterium]|nr:hypothetical protein [Bryobacteraceae bacterium]
MSGRTYVQGCGYHEIACAPPDIVADFLEQRGFLVQVIRLDQVDADSDCASNALLLVRQRQSEH